jgi:hypothetical protein
LQPRPERRCIIRSSAAQERRSDVVAPTGKASGTVRSAQTAAMEFPELDIRVVDTLTVSCNLGSLVLVADIGESWQMRMVSSSTIRFRAVIFLWWIRSNI